MILTRYSVTAVRNQGRNFAFRQLFRSIAVPTYVHLLVEQFHGVYRTLRFSTCSSAPIREHGRNLAVVQSLVFLLEVVVQSVRPFTHTSDVQPNVIILLWCTAQSEWMPFILCNIRNIHENVVSRSEMEVGWPFDHQVCNFGGQKDTGGDISLAAFRAQPQDSENPFNRVDESWNDEPLPEIRAVEENQNPERNVQQVGPVEYLKFR